jgi:poly(A) polymerase
MAVRLPDKAPIDPHGGLDDLRKKLLRTPADPKDSFSDDPLRMLRAFRFASQLDFKIDRAALEAIEVLREELRHISAERIRDELTKLLLGESPARALDLADQVGLTDIFLPELGALKLQQDPVQRHKDVFHHTLAVVERTDKNIVLRLAALLHDIGKPRTRKIDESGVSFHQHDVVGAKMARKRLQELRFPNDVVEAVSEIIRLHHRFHGYEGQWTDSAVRRYVRDAGANLHLLNLMVRADCTTRDPAKAKVLARRVDDLEQRITDLAAREELGKLRPELDGRKVMELLELEPGPDVGRAMDHLMEIRLDEGTLGEEEITRRLLEWADENGIGRFAPEHS